MCTIDGSQSRKGNQDGEECQEWLYNISKGIDLWKFLEERVKPFKFNVKFNFVRSVTGHQGKLFIVLDDNFKQLLVIIDHDKWRDQSSKKSGMKELEQFKWWDDVAVVHPLVLPNDLKPDTAKPNDVTDVWKIAVNPSGCLVALISTVCFTVLSVEPTSITTNKKHLWTYWIEPLTQITDAKWHPLSPFFRHLAILTIDGVLRLYNCASTNHHPEQIFSFVDDLLIYPAVHGELPQVKCKASPHLAASKSFSSYQRPSNTNPHKSDIVDRGTILGDKNANQHQFVALAFNAGPKSGWKGLSAYATTSLGSIVIICGILPFEFSLNLEDLHALSVQAPNVMEPLDVSNMNLGYVHNYWNMRFVQDIMAQIDMDTLDPLQNHLVLKKPLQKMCLVPSDMHQFPYFEQNMYITDILAINLEAISVIAIACCTGNVYIGLDLTWIEPMWNLGEKERSSLLRPSIHWFERIELGVNENQKNLQSKIHKSIQMIYREQKHSFYIIHDFGVVEVDLNPLVKKIDDIIREFSNYSNDQIPSLVDNWPDIPATNLYTPSNAEDAHSSSSPLSYGTSWDTKLKFSIIDSIYGNSILLVLTDNMNLSGSHIPVTPQTVRGRDAKRLTDIAMPVSDKERYVPPKLSSILSPSIVYNPHEITRNLDLNRLEYPKFVSLAGIKALSTISSLTHERIVNAVTAIEVMNTRMDLLEKEIGCQNDLWEYLSMKNIVDEPLAALSETRKRLEKIKTRQVSLDNHSFLLMRLALDSDNRLSQEELDWFNYISALKRSIDTCFIPQINELYLEYAKIKYLVEKTKSEIILFNTHVASSECESQSAEKFKVLLRDLNMRYADIDNIKKKMTHIARLLSQQETSQ